MPRGGKRPGAGRPMNSGAHKQKTRVIRVPCDYDLQKEMQRQADLHTANKNLRERLEMAINLAVEVINKHEGVEGLRERGFHMHADVLEENGDN